MATVENYFEGFWGENPEPEKGVIFMDRVAAGGSAILHRANRRLALYEEVLYNDPTYPNTDVATMRDVRCYLFEQIVKSLEGGPPSNKSLFVTQNTAPRKHGSYRSRTRRPRAPGDLKYNVASVSHV